MGENVVDPFFFRSRDVLGFGLELAVGMVEYAVAFAFSDVERFSVPRVYQAVYVVFQLVVD